MKLTVQKWHPVLERVHSLKVNISIQHTHSLRSGCIVIAGAFVFVCHSQIFGGIWIRLGK